MVVCFNSFPIVILGVGPIKRKNEIGITSGIKLNALKDNNA